MSQYTERVENVLKHYWKLNLSSLSRHCSIAEEGIKLIEESTVVKTSLPLEAFFLFEGLSACIFDSLLFVGKLDIF